MIDICKRFAERPDWEGPDDAPEEVVAEKDIERHVWKEVMKQVQEPFEILSEAVDQGLEHAGMCLELLPRPKKKASGKAGESASGLAEADVEAGDEPKPGDPGFSRIIDEKIQTFYCRKGELLRTWVQERGISLDEESPENSSFRSERDQVQLYVILYLENLMHASGQAVQDLIDFADEKVEDGTMSKKRLITPSLRRLRKWFLAVLSNKDPSADQSPDVMESSANIIYFGDGYNRKKDPEHLPPVTAWQRFGNGLRKIPAFLGSEESAFGFRVACATLTIGIVGFLESTQRFFMEQRLVWAMILVAIGGVFSYLLSPLPSPFSLCSPILFLSLPLFLSLSPFSFLFHAVSYTRSPAFLPPFFPFLSIPISFSLPTSFLLLYNYCLCLE